MELDYLWLAKIRIILPFVYVTDAQLLWPQVRKWCPMTQPSICPRSQSSTCPKPQSSTCSRSQSSLFNPRSSQILPNVLTHQSKEMFTIAPFLYDGSCNYWNLDLKLNSLLVGGAPASMLSITDLISEWCTYSPSMCQSYKLWSPRSVVLKLWSIDLWGSAKVMWGFRGASSDYVKW